MSDISERWLRNYYDTIRRLQIELSREVQPGALVPVHNMRAMIATHDLLNWLAEELAVYPDDEGLSDDDDDPWSLVSQRIMFDEATQL